MSEQVQYLPAPVSIRTIPSKAVFTLCDIHCKHIRTVHYSRACRAKTNFSSIGTRHRQAQAGSASPLALAVGLTDY